MFLLLKIFVYSEKSLLKITKLGYVYKIQFYARYTDFSDHQIILKSRRFELFGVRIDCIYLVLHK